jgi:hypothetical protein
MSPRSQNKQSDALSKLTSVRFSHPAKEIRVEVLQSPTTEAEEICSIQFGNDSWIGPIHTYLSVEHLPENREKAHRIQTQALQYKLENGILYRRSFLGPLLRCVDADEAKTMVREIHEGMCGIHAGPRSVVAKAINVGYYWPDMHLTAVEEIRKCQSCQKHAPLMHRPKNDLIPVTSAWPFQKWGIDIVGPFLEAARRVKYLILATDYFTKWVEAEPVATITSLQVKKFLWKNIVCRYGIPMVLISDSGTQLQIKGFRNGVRTSKFNRSSHPWLTRMGMDRWREPIKV